MNGKISIIAFAALAVGACGTTSNINRFRAFAELGQTYQSAVTKVVDQASASNIDADSQLLMFGRENMIAGGDISRLPNDIERANVSVIETNRVYSRLRRQVALLNDYFRSLGALADFDGDPAIGSSAGSVVSALRSLFPGGQEVKIGSANPVDITSGVASLVVANVRSRRLAEELRRNGGEIDRQLAVQAQLLEALAEDIRNDQEIIVQRRLLDDVIAPFAGNGALPANWSQRRRELLVQMSAAADPAQEAAALSRRMRTAFADLVAGRLQAGDLVIYANDLSRLVAIAEKIDGSGGK
jgi:hypothetical protein